MLAVPANAALTASAPDGFTSQSEATIAVAPAAAWAALVQWPNWWSPAHSYSRTSPSLEARAGGRLVEAWPGGEVLHAVVLNAQPPKLLRMSGGFGPLLSLPVNAILDFTLSPAGTGTKVTMTYRVAGNAAAKLDSLAAPVDAVMSEGFARFTRFAVTSKPE
ncbi:MAG: SRPBCC family protein [Polymorphobacter sp.]